MYNRLQNSVTLQGYIFMQKILYILPSIDYGGAELLALWQINELYSRGYEIHLLVLGKLVQLPCPLLLPENHITVLNHSYGTIHAASIAYTPKAVAAIVLLLQRQRPTVVLAHLPLSHWLLRWAVAGCRVWGMRLRLYNYHHGTFFTDQIPTGYLVRLFCIMNHRLAKWVDDGNIAVSQAVINSWERQTHLPHWQLLYNSVPYQLANTHLAQQYLQQQQLNNAPYTVLLPGRLHAVKGHVFFLGVWRRFIQQNALLPSDVLLLIAGEGSERANIEQYMAQAQLGGYVHLCGGVEQHLLWSLMRWADLCVVPSLSEGLGNVAIEALIQQTTLLVSDAGGLPEVVQHQQTGFVFERANAEQCLHWLQYLYEHRGQTLLRHELMLQRYQQHFAPERHMRQLQAIINERAQ